MPILYLDCFAGISGNMLLGAFLNLGVPEERLREELLKLPIQGYELVINRVSKCGISAIHVDVVVHDHQPHRHLPDILAIIEHSTLEYAIKEDSKKVFMRLAAAEAKVHGTTIDHIHFHEVGAIDAIVDIVGTVFCFHYLNIKEIYNSNLHVGNGFVRCSHGLMPVPAPATAELLLGIPYYSGEIHKELVTPTGAAFIATFSKSVGTMPKDFISRKIGYGAGTWELDIPNVLRMQLGDWEVKQTNDQIIVVETNIDDLNPQVYDYVMDRLFAVGALDVCLTPIVMKKGRPAVRFTVLLNAHLLDKVADILFSETSTIGIRYYNVERTIADRKQVVVSVPWGQAHVKISSHLGKICNVSPEYQDCRQLAETNDVPLKVVQQYVLEQGLLIAKTLI